MKFTKSDFEKIGLRITIWKAKKQDSDYLVVVLEPVDNRHVKRICKQHARQLYASCGMMQMFNMGIGEVIFGGVGVGLIGMLFYVILSMFIAGLMIGSTPEFLGKKTRALRNDNGNDFDASADDINGNFFRNSDFNARPDFQAEQSVIARAFGNTICVHFRPRKQRFCFRRT